MDDVEKLASAGAVTEPTDWDDFDIDIYDE